MRTIITIAVALFIGAISARDYQRAPTRTETLNQRLQRLENQAEKLQNRVFDLSMKIQDVVQPDELSVERSFFNKIGDGFKKAGRGIEKGAQIAAPYAIPALELAGELGGLSVEDPMIFDGYYPQVETSFFKKIGHGFKKAEPYILPAIKIAGELGGLSVQGEMYDDDLYRYYPQVEKNIFTKIGHGLRRAEPYIGPAIKIAGAIGGLSVEDPYLAYSDVYYPEVERSIFNKIGDGFKKAGRGIEKGAQIAAPYAIPALEIAGELAGGLSVEEPRFLDGYPDVERSIFNKIGDGFKKAGRGIEKGAQIAAPYAIPALELAGTLAGGLSVEQPFFYDGYPDVERSIFNKIGDGFKKAGRGIEKGAKIAAPYAIPALEIAGTIALGGLSVEEPNVQQVFYGPNYYPYPYPYPYPYDD